MKCVYGIIILFLATAPASAQFRRTPMDPFRPPAIPGLPGWYGNIGSPGDFGGYYSGIPGFRQRGTTPPWMPNTGNPIQPGFSGWNGPTGGSLISGGGFGIIGNNLPIGGSGIPWLPASPNIGVIGNNPRSGVPNFPFNSTNPTPPATIYAPPIKIEPSKYLVLPE